MQTTIKSPARFNGVGLHSGKPVQMVIHPASAEHGIWFKRTDIRVGDALIPARWDAVNQTPLCTRIENARGADVSTIEHIMAALVGCGVHNALIEIDGPEVPIMDGSAAEFVRGHDLTIGGDFPHNTSGGQLSAGQAGAAGGFIGMVEAIRQVTGQAGPTQVSDAKRAMASGFGMINYDRGLCSAAAIIEEGVRA